MKHGSASGSIDYNLTFLPMSLGLLECLAVSLDYPTARWLEFFVCSYGAYVSVVSLIVFFIVLQKRLLLLSHCASKS
jgi:hypothetical protein